MSAHFLMQGRGGCREKKTSEICADAKVPSRARVSQRMSRVLSLSSTERCSKVLKRSRVSRLSKRGAHRRALSAGTDSVVGPKPICLATYRRTLSHQAGDLVSAAGVATTGSWRLERKAKQRSHRSALSMRLGWIIPRWYSTACTVLCRVVSKPIVVHFLSCLFIAQVLQGVLVRQQAAF